MDAFPVKAACAAVKTRRLDDGRFVDFAAVVPGKHNQLVAVGVIRGHSPQLVPYQQIAGFDFGIQKRLNGGISPPVGKAVDQSVVFQYPPPLAEKLRKERFEHLQIAEGGLVAVVGHADVVGRVGNNQIHAVIGEFGQKFQAVAVLQVHHLNSFSNAAPKGSMISAKAARCLGCFSRTKAYSISSTFKAVASSEVSGSTRLLAATVLV